MTRSRYRPPGLPAIRNLLLQEPEANAFLLGDITAHGLSRPPFQEASVETDASGKPMAVLLRHFGVVLYYEAPGSEPDRARLGRSVADWVRSGKATRMSALNRCLDPLEPWLPPLHRSQRLHLASCRPDTAVAPGWLATVGQRAADDGLRILGTGPEDQDLVERIVRAQRQIPEFTVSDEAVQVIMEGLRSGQGFNLIAMREEEIIARAAWGAANEASAMIVGVFTLPRWRGRGLASLLVADLVRRLHLRGLIAALFYDNPAAGSIYKRLGFVDMDRYRMVHFA